VTGRRIWVAVTVAIACVGGGAACSQGRSGPSARLSVVGTAQVGGGRGHWRDVSSATVVHAGDGIRLKTGTATLGLGGGVSLELRPGTEVALKGPDGGSGRLRPDLRAGLALAVAGNGPPLVVTIDGVVVRTQAGAARLSARPGVVADYSAGVTLKTPQAEVMIPPLFQSSLGTGSAPTAKVPLVYSASDPWDQRFLGGAIETGSRLTSRSEGFSAQIKSNEARGAAFLRRVLPALAGQDFDDTSVDPKRPPGDSLVGAAIVLEGTRGTFRSRWQEVFAFRDLGAPWTLVVADQAVADRPVVSVVDEAIGRAVALLNPPLSPLAPGGARPPAPGTGPGGSSHSPGPGASLPAPGPNGTLPGEPPPVQTGIPLIDNTGNGLVDTLNGLLNGLGH